jgi:phosphohistidine phosphatase
MEIILLRHGKAQNTHIDGDFYRALVERGRQQSRQAAKLLKTAGILPEIVLSSPLTRARQTAEEFCRAAEMPGAVIQGWLACGMSPELALAELAAFRDFSRIAIVGHEPDFSQLIEWILGTKGGVIDVKKGTLACLQISPPSRQGSLIYLIPTKLTESAEGP